MLAKDTRSSGGGALARFTEALSLGNLHLPSMKDIKGMLASSHSSADLVDQGADHGPEHNGPSHRAESPSTPTETSAHATFEDMHSSADAHERANQLANSRTLDVDQRDEAINLLTHITDADLRVRLESKVEDTLQKIDYQNAHKEEKQLLAREDREETTVLQQFRQRFMQALGKLINKIQPVPGADTSSGTDVA